MITPGPRSTTHYCNLGRFITELGHDFCFVGSEYPVQVRNQDFAIHLVFFNRGLTCLVVYPACPACRCVLA